jgi:hypothetical protein
MFQHRSMEASRLAGVIAAHHFVAQKHAVGGEHIG